MEFEDDSNGALALRSHGLTVRKVREETREVDFVASTDAIDSWDEIVEQVWKLDRFKTNPVILYGHKSRELPIGTATRCDVVKQADGRDALECTILFATAEMNPLAEQVFKMVQAKILRAVSVGFNPGSYRYEKRDGQEICVLSDNELHEISVVAIPANAEALAKMRAKARKEARAARGEVDDMKTIEELQKEVDETKLAAKMAVQTENTARELAEERATKAEKALADEQTFILAEVRAIREAAGAGKEEKTVDAVKRLATERVAAEDKALEHEMKGLVGVKFLPNELEEMTELAQTNRKLFDKMIAKRGDLKILKAGMTEAPVEENSATEGDAGGEDALKAISGMNIDDGGDSDAMSAIRAMDA